MELCQGSFLRFIDGFYFLVIVMRGAGGGGYADCHRGVVDWKRYRGTLKSISQRVVLDFGQRSGRAYSVGLCGSATVRESRR